MTVADDPVLIELKTTCTATVVETWTLRVPPDVAARVVEDPDDALDLLDQLSLNGIEFLNVTDEVSDEEDRSLLEVRTFDAEGNPASIRAICENGPLDSPADAAERDAHDHPPRRCEEDGPGDA